MSDTGLHYITDELKDSWVEDWVGVGIAQMEALLTKHAAFLNYLETQES